MKSGHIFMGATLDIDVKVNGKVVDSLRVWNAGRAGQGVEDRYEILKPDLGDAGHVIGLADEHYRSLLPKILARIEFLSV